MKRPLLLLVLGLAALSVAGCPSKPAAPPPPTTTNAAPYQRPKGTVFGNEPGKTTTAARPSGKAASPAEEQMLLGNPDGANDRPDNRDHYLMVRPEFALSYNDSLRFPNWVSWHLSTSDIGDTERGQFRPDPDLPSGFTVITTGDYTGSGYDRGHNCPSKDRSASREQNDVAFYMTNITPQQHGMNAGPWEKLEMYSRQLAQQGNELYITCGHGFTDRSHATIGRDQIAVPDFGWKIIVVLPEQSGDDLARITADARVIAIRMPNISTISRQPWDKYITTVAELEKATGLTFFQSLPAEIAEVLKQKRDGGQGSFSQGESGVRSSRRRRSGGSFGTNDDNSGFGGGRRR